MTNVGWKYDPESSVFVCGDTGYYLFSLNLRATDNHRMDAEIMVNGRSVAGVLAHNDWDHASNTVVVLCSEYDPVFVKCTRDKSEINGGSTKQSLFTGVFLFPA